MDARLREHDSLVYFYRSNKEQQKCQGNFLSKISQSLFQAHLK